MKKEEFLTVVYKITSAEQRKRILNSTAADWCAASSEHTIKARDEALEKVAALEELLKMKLADSRSDTRRMDWLSDPDNSIGCVQLPTHIVTANLHSLRDAIDAAMEIQKQ